MPSFRAGLSTFSRSKVISPIYEHWFEGSFKQWLLERVIFYVVEAVSAKLAGDPTWYNQTPLPGTLGSSYTYTVVSFLVVEAIKCWAGAQIEKFYQREGRDARATPAPR
ncbi:hypothetical protein P280DRAFT_518603 [Massarina eburnea CBS 473.64]|uniref:Uncharacterized protein n=1 Tax=Massarina eburnea CBS 473.64 TaxID=1395130 RepID=A0A6A6S0J6_9PLEO|nr:hypothetical protein P280DRAFT_518603 [Massarina eburnea CBS 473.64]